MNIKRKDKSVLFKGLVIAVAFALAVLCMPVNILPALAQMNDYTDYSYMTIGTVDSDVKTVVNRGEKYDIPNAYIGGYKKEGNNVVVGKTTGTELSGTVENLTSSVKVSYATQEFEEVSSEEGEDLSNSVVISGTGVEEGSYGYFYANKIGTYTITYSYSYTIDEKTYTSSYDLKVESKLSSVTINLEDNGEVFLPSVIDLNLAKEGDSYKNMNLPLPKLIDENSEEIKVPVENYVVSSDEIGKTGNYVLITVTSANSATPVEISGEAGNYYVDGSVFAEPETGATTYTVRYAVYTDGAFVTATSKTVKVVREYYTKYELKLELDSDWVDNGQTGVESSLPKAVGVTASSTTPSAESVDVYYTVAVYYRSSGSASNYALIDVEKYNNVDNNKDGKVDAEDKIFNEDGTLIDPSTFKPLEDGWYTFVYTIKDFYGNPVSSTKGVYEFANIKDEQKPTPIVYDADKAADHTVDISNQLKSRAVPNSVVVYAIGIEDNVSTATTEGVVLTRRIMTDDTNVALTIEDYDKYNLVFNYRGTSESIKAYNNLLSNNYLIRKQVVEGAEEGQVDSDIDMLGWLQGHEYLIVVDNANYQTIYDIFNSEGYFADKNVNTSTAASEEDKYKENTANALEWFKSDAGLKKGFAYIDTDKTFGALTSNDGLGTGQFYIHYVAKDAAGNETDVSKSMYIGSYTDNERPVINFTTTLSDTYLPSSVIKFDAPTASDNYDSNMLVKTLYRYRNSQGTVLTANSKGEAFDMVDLSELLNDLKDTSSGQTIDESTYKNFLGTNNNYIDLTDVDASSYSIDLSEATAEATELQILVYTYDDCGLANIYVESINIANTIDNAPPKFEIMDTNDALFKDTYVQGQEIVLPTLSVFDDAVGYMSFDVNVYYVNGNTRTAVPSYDEYSEREILGTSGAGRYTVHAGKFVASFAGNYEVSIAVKDSNNKTIVSSVNYEVTPRTIIQPPVINSSMESRTVELDGDDNYDPEVGIEISTPSVSYQIPDSTTYDEFIAGNSDETYVVLGVDKNGKATNWDTPFGTAKSFIPEKTGEYTIQYNVKLTVYNHNTFEWKDFGWDDEAQDYTEGGYFVYTNSSVGKTANVVVLSETEYKVECEGTTYTVVVNKENDTVDVLDGSDMSLGGLYEHTIFQGVDLQQWVNDLKLYVLTSDSYTISVVDNKGPQFDINGYNYVDAISTEGTENGYDLTIYGIQASDKSGIDYENSQIVLSWKLATTGTGTKTFNGTKDEVYKIEAVNGKILDGTYTITYTIKDNNGNTTTASKEISVGDDQEPVMTFDEGFVLDSYTVGSELKIDITKIHVEDENLPEDWEPQITLVNSSTTDEEIKYRVVGDYYVFDLDEIGTYTLTVEVSDTAGNVASQPFTISVTARTTDTEAVYKTVGTILIVISVLILVGVIVYFIVSKVKLDRELKK